jgi:hypothetical protein
MFVLFYKPNPNNEIYLITNLLGGTAGITVCLPTSYP